MRAGVESADDALQLGELFHQLGGQIAFAKLRGADGVVVSADLPHEIGDAIGLGEIASELGLERDVGQIGQAVGQLLALVGIPEEAGVVEAGAENALVAAADEGLRDRRWCS